MAIIRGVDVSTLFKVCPPPKKIKKIKWNKTKQAKTYKTNTCTTFSGVVTQSVLECRGK